jgi:hypothetical protein
LDVRRWVSGREDATDDENPEQRRNRHRRAPMSRNRPTQLCTRRDDDGDPASAQVADRRRQRRVLIREYRSTPNALV